MPSHTKTERKKNKLKKAINKFAGPLLKDTLKKVGKKNKRLEKARKKR